ncbi:uncharacterized protein UBRO_20563 [Ustilago bromivora]|uniref:Uncharacterized protein n=1 Tax=Ustilago bromivora TaxID=307758 RepID=A0A1K0G0I9_9BASI|nr:uncharacterized protein UBRO_20563 [Ustilago bromivora]
MKLVGEMAEATKRLWRFVALEMRLCNLNDDHGKGMFGAVESGESQEEVVVGGAKQANNVVTCQYVYERSHDFPKLILFFDEVLGELFEQATIPRALVFYTTRKGIRAIG